MVLEKVNIIYYTNAEEKIFMEKIKNGDYTAFLEFKSLNLPYIAHFIKNKEFTKNTKNIVKISNKILENSILKFSKTNLDMPFNTYLNLAITNGLMEFIKK